MVDRYFYSRCWWAIKDRKASSEKVSINRFIRRSSYQKFCQSNHCIQKSLLFVLWHIYLTECDIPDFTYIGVVATTASIEANQCGFPKRTTPHPRPETLPFEFFLEKNQKLKDWLIEHYSRPTFYKRTQTSHETAGPVTTETFQSER